MFETIFEADNGKKFTFGRSGGNIYGMSIGDGLSVALGTSQGFSQIGETVETKGVGGRTIDVTGELYGNIEERKNALSNVCAPLTSGRLVFNKAHFIRVHVKSAPTMSPKKGNGRFKMQFYAPFPFYSTIDEKSCSLGEVVPMFRFPINYSGLHTFGKKTGAKATNVENDGDVRVPFRVTIRATGDSSNVTITNLKNRKYLRINENMHLGDQIEIYRDQDNAVRAELTSAGETSDILAKIDEDSTLFELETGENLLNASDNEGGANLSVQFTYYPAKAVLYET